MLLFFSAVLYTRKLETLAVLDKKTQVRMLDSNVPSEARPETAASATATARSRVCLFINTDRQTDLAIHVAVAEVANSDRPMSKSAAMTTAGSLHHHALKYRLTLARALTMSRS